MLTNKLIYCVKTAFRNIAANLLLNAVAASTIAITFIIFVSFVLFTANLAALQTTLSSQGHIIAYLKDAVAPADRDRTRSMIASIPGVHAVRFVSREEALALLRGMLQGQDGIIEGLKENPLSDSFEIRLADDRSGAEGLAAAVAALEKIETIADVEYGRAWIDRFAALFDIIRICGFMLAGLLFLFSLIIVANTIKLLIYHRRDEIEIMKLVGATGAFIKLPLCLEGIMQGFAGAAAALIFIYVAAFALKEPVIQFARVYLGSHQFFFLDPLSCGAVLALGAGLGLAGSLFAVGALEEMQA